MFKKFLNIFKNSCGCAKPGTNKTVLVIDDGDSERSFLIRSLKKAGYSVIDASRGDQGLELAESQQPDMILLDYMMPGMDGNEVCRKLKNNPKTKAIPVVFLTGSTRPETVITCYDVGAEHYLSKPISAKILLDQVRSTLEGQPAA